MTWRQSNNQWSGGIADHPGPKKFRLQKFVGKVLTLIFCDEGGILLIIFQRIKLSTRTINSSLLVQLKDILKKKHRGKFTKVVLFLHDNAPSSPGICNPEETDLPEPSVFWSPTLFSGSGPVGLLPVPWTEENNWKIAIFRPTRRS